MKVTKLRLHLVFVSCSSRNYTSFASDNPVTCFIFWIRALYVLCLIMSKVARHLGLWCMSNLKQKFQGQCNASESQKSRRSHKGEYPWKKESWALLVTWHGKLQMEDERSPCISVCALECWVCCREGSLSSLQQLTVFYGK